MRRGTFCPPGTQRVDVRDGGQRTGQPSKLPSGELFSFLGGTSIHSLLEILKEKQDGGGGTGVE